MKVVLASKNAHKLQEISKITEKFDMELVLESQVGVDIDVEETGSTFEENSFIKAEAVMKATGLPALADDSGIAVDALNGEPGIYSARYGFDPSLDDWGRLELLLKNTEQVPDGSRQAQFVCVITLVTPEGQVIQARGEAYGELLRQPAGEGGFGYDPIFYYPPLGKSFAELSPEEKNQVSHRAQALKLFYEKLKEAGYADK
ncbi:MAG TPA: RdgB/HAM1 family non-canonical purine NTP pyrophosphatase [Candidatus Faecousia excrementigallinarum]|uniref:dITP/XTP pyrophosphatase n=1 Tax=Candidatus Faecousia excrementigallinarum TaxID=2840806 RepID=A0A9D0Z405_9FIRM|nr:RdgB/HAM1 family non-canonical purine NTP pyrophosphatase [Candidatus Faecousia excrementigallinarum]